MYFVLAKSFDGWVSLATEALLRSAFFDASFADNIKDIKILRWQSNCDAACFLTGKKFHKSTIFWRRLNLIRHSCHVNQVGCLGAQPSSQTKLNKSWKNYALNPFMSLNPLSFYYSYMSANEK